jgi:hypothetical protein
MFDIYLSEYEINQNKYLFDSNLMHNKENGTVDSFTGPTVEWTIDSEFCKID